MVTDWEQVGTSRFSLFESTLKVGYESACYLEIISNQKLILIDLKIETQLEFDIKIFNEEDPDISPYPALSRSQEAQDKSHTVL